MTTLATPPSTATFVEKLSQIVPPERIILDDARLDSLSKDFYWYSPVLEALLKDKKADVVVQPKSKGEIEQIIRLAFAEKMPVTMRGSGTGNYGQCIPLKGGLLIDMALFDEIYGIDTELGTINCAAGCRLGQMEPAARKVGWELRSYPSTWVKASVGGFVCGGSGGIGSITYGGLRENQVREMEILTMEAEPRTIVLTGQDIFQVMHAWGTNAIVVRVVMNLAPRVNWAQAAVAFDTLEQANDFCFALGENESIKKRLVTSFEWPIPSFFTPLLKWVPTGKPLAFFEIEDASLDRFKEWAGQAAGTVVFEQPFQEPRRGPLLSDYTWNHTTLWALKFDKSWTYLQCGTEPARWREQLATLKAKYGSDFLLHIEFVRTEGKVTVGFLPVVKYTTKENLQEMIDYCRSIGVGVANPHINNLEESGRWRADDAKVVAKRTYDPAGLLNPGKMRSVE
jgi:FAD/FMN-containing dehydrogenase